MTDEPITIRDLLSELTLGEKLWLLAKIYWRKLIDALILPFIIIGDWIFRYKEGSAYTPEQEEIVVEAWDKTVKQIQGEVTREDINYRPDIELEMGFHVNGDCWWCGWNRNRKLKFFIDDHEITVSDSRVLRNWFGACGFDEPDEMVRYYENKGAIEYVPALTQASYYTYGPTTHAFYGQSWAESNHYNRTTYYTVPVYEEDGTYIRNVKLEVSNHPSEVKFDRWGHNLEDDYDPGDA